MSRRTSGGFRRLPRIADQMTPDLYACVDRSLAAERAGDAASALEWHQAVPAFRSGRHRSLLERLAQLGEDVPAWVWARWIVYQTIRCEGGETGALLRGRRQQVVADWHADLLDDCFEAQGDPVQVIARVLGESWVFHQVAPHEQGVLSAFVDEFASGRLAEHADLALTWAGARLSGYRIGESLPGARLRIREAHSDEWLDVLDIGAASTGRGASVLGRLVPSGIGDLLMFDTPPLPVPSSVATAVAQQADGDWTHALAAAIDAGQLSPAELLREDYELATDVTELELLRFATAPRDHARVLGQLRSGRDEIGRAAFRVLERARGGELAAADQAQLGAAVLNPRGFDGARRVVSRFGEGLLGDWVGRVAEPARSRLLDLLGR